AVLAAAPAMKPSKRRDVLIEHAERARLSRELVLLRADVPLPQPIDALAQRNPDPSVLLAWLGQQGFRSTIARLGLGPGAMQGAAVPVPREATGAQAQPDTGPAGFGPYEAVTTEAALRTWAEEAATTGRIAIDILSEGPDLMRARLIGIGIATAPGRACYVPLGHEGLVAQLPAGAALSMLAPLLTDRSVLKIFQDAKPAMLVLAHAGFPQPATIDDTMLISYAQEAGMHGHGLDELSRLHLGHSPVSRDEATGTGRNRLPLAQVPVERAAAHAAEAADVMLRLWETMRPRLRLNGGLALYEQMERRLLPILLDMERAGVKVDADDLSRMSADFETRMATMEQDCRQLAGRPFNLGSPKQLGEVLFDEMKLPGGKRMKTGAWGTDSSVLQTLADQGHELPARVLEWRQLQKLKSTYADALVGEINPNTGRVHTNYAMAIASTGRLSSTDPNLQNIPIRTEEGSRIRRAFIAEPGHVLVSADYSQIELRLLAHVADIPALKE
ncbi:MAG TPA: DNA polymerase, partial [Acetobacteraceae bacterium]